MTALRDYQQDLIRNYESALAAGKRSILLVVHTAAGKTVVASAIVNREVANGKRVLFIAHRRELIKQARKRLGAFGIDAGIILAGEQPAPELAVQVASIQTLWHRGMRSNKIEMPEADIVFIDEAHHARAKTYEKTLARYPNAIIIGLTATPIRMDGRGLGNIFDCLIVGPDALFLIEHKFLVPTITYAPVRPDLKGVKVAKGDYVTADLAKRMDREQLVGDIVTHWLRYAQDRLTVVFATNVAHARHLCEEFLKAGVAAGYVHGGTPKPERDKMLAQLASDEIRVVVNCAVLIEGWDLPEVGCVILARPTKSLCLYRQMVGRGMRVAEGKENLLEIGRAHV